MEYKAWVALRPRFKAACQIAVEACDTPEERQRLADRAESLSGPEVLHVDEIGPPDRLQGPDRPAEGPIL